ncbi:hypothetical protein LBMAG56_09360 [Verrucomicrobiota bacterium]|nr:hypothetical protein LBMAG56_09360 [Verrucomicrobiota bacterium]
MASGDNIATTIFNFRYRHGVDEKRRVQIPKPWRPADEDTEFTLMLWSKSPHGPCLRMLPRAQFDKLMQDVEAMSGSDPLKAARKRALGSWSLQVTFDKTGRICIPDALANEAGILPNQEVWLVGLTSSFEIWNPERLANVDKADRALSADVFRDLE